jgi:hypothetical protein
VMSTTKSTNNKHIAAHICSVLFFFSLFVHEMISCYARLTVCSLFVRCCVFETTGFV